MEANPNAHHIISLPPGFHFGSAHTGSRKGPKAPSSPHTSLPPPLGVLSNFTGTFVGTGLNMIFRPNSVLPTTTTFPNPVTPPPPTRPNENVLEINLTTETLDFSASLGSVPNRGLESQNDIFLNGVPYVQVVNDVTNTETGRGDGVPVGIHFEPGLWMHVPATTVNPVLAESLSRMASIPHGTTINAVGLAPTAAISGPPTIFPASITPFPIGNIGSPIRFRSQTAADADTPRLPQDLTKFIAAGTITQEILDDPNTVLRNAIKDQNITSAIAFTVSTAPAAPESGGGTANIAFNQGAPGAGPNADAVLMTSTFWIETVEHTIVIPASKPGQSPIKIQGNAPQGGVAPTFVFTPQHEIPKPITIKVTSPQIQYSQNVFLDFATLTWPHVSVATLVPSTELPIPFAALEKAVQSA